jgi:hypothetical protein
MPTYQVLRKPFWTSTGAVPPGTLLELPAAVGDGHPNNLRRVPEHPAPQPAVVEQSPLPAPGLGELLPADVVGKLAQAGLTPVAMVRAASDGDLRRVPGIGRATARKIREALDAA